MKSMSKKVQNMETEKQLLFTVLNAWYVIDLTKGKNTLQML